MQTWGDGPMYMHNILMSINKYFKVGTGNSECINLAVHDMALRVMDGPKMGHRQHLGKAYFA